jgi:DNA-binding transcriptional regulator YiaG
MKQARTKKRTKGALSIRTPLLVNDGNFESLLIASAKEARSIGRGKLQAAQRHRLTSRSATVDAPPPIDRESVVSLRTQLGVSQPVFAKLLNASAPLVKKWEQGTRKPAGPAARLLQMFAQDLSVARALVRRGALNGAAVRKK